MDTHQRGRVLLGGDPLAGVERRARDQRMQLRLADGQPDPSRRPDQVEAPGLEALHEEYAARGFTVIGVPCNQFKGQEPGTSEEIAEFCSATYGVTFPMTEKVEVNGSDAHPLYQQLTTAPDASGEAGDVLWNFEKFLVAPDGSVAARFRPRTEPDAPEVRAAIESLLPR